MFGPRFQGHARDNVSAEPTAEPFRTRILGKEEREHARALAEADEILPRLHAGKPLLPRLVENGKALLACQREFTVELQARQGVPPAAEWLLDNYYVVEQTLQQTRQDLSPTFYNELPKLAGGTLAGYPRVYGIAVELIAQNDNRLSQDALARFIDSYQERAPLSMGEVWAVPIMLRIALIENLRRLMEQARAELERQRAANALAAELLAASAGTRAQFSSPLTRLEQDAAAQNDTFILQLVLRLRDQDPTVAPALAWLDAQIQRKNTSLEDLIRTENQRRAQLRTLTGNLITSLRLLAAIDWHVFFESVSVVERVLHDDPSGMYPQMDFDSRDRYRHVIETLAQHDPAAEVEIAHHAVTLASSVLASAQFQKPQALTAETEYRRHVGYFLLDEGLTQLEADVHYRPPLSVRARRTLFRNATAFYLGAIALLLLLFIAGAVVYAASTGANMAMLVLVVLLTFIPLSVLAVGIVNWILAVKLKPYPPPKLELIQIAPEYRTMVVIPALIVNKSGLEYLLEHLELRFLANRDPHLHFAILGDFADAPQEHMPEDDELLETALRRVRELNRLYERADAFFFLHRRRVWNASEDCWMGWERKRGKLEEFNLLLRGGETSYAKVEGDLSILPKVKYVITLDADTELPLQVARRLVGTIAHPLNRAVLDPVTRHITRGYGIIQPRVDVVASAASRSRFARLFAGDTGLDPYASVVSNVYQDLFRRAVYIGKAIYDVDAMLGALRGRFPENLLLSHDLLEGSFLRVGFASDIELLEDFPSGFDTFAQRQHRWVRGDWQITNWLSPRVRDASGRREKNPLAFIERWKIFDNLRRSLIAPATVLLFLAAWTILPGSRAVWTLVALFCIVFPFVRGALIALTVRPVGETLNSYLWALAQELWTLARRGILTLIFLLYFTTINLDAVGTSLVRRVFTHRRLLQWTSHAVAERGHARGFGEYVSRMWLASALSLVIAIGLAFVDSRGLLLAAPLFLLWFLAPSIAYSISQPIQTPTKPLPDAARAQLRATARRIWRFYEDFAGEQDHWLPPDNYQVEPGPVVAHRTSPTNIGFLLLSTIAAYDFGYVERAEFVERVEQVFHTLDQMERRHGHFINWYDTLTLQPLHPVYISTVDSGNLAASLVTLKQTCLEIMHTPRDSARVWNGLVDTLDVLDDTLARVADIDVKPLRREAERLRAATRSSSAFPDANVSSRMTLGQFETRALYLARLARRLALTGALTREIRAWCDALVRQARRAQEPTASSLAARLDMLARCADEYVAAMDFAFLYDSVRGVFAIGYNEEHHRRDDSYFDLLASEARLTSFLAVARGEIPVKHWFRLGRPLTRVAGKAALLSWGGTMFEYLMPPLLMRDHAPSLLHQSQLAAIQEQIGYAARQHLPWGVSESGFYAFDYQFNYQYRAFGAPVLSLKREFILPRVIAPYATFLALPFAPHAASANLSALAELGGADGYGFFEALDFSPEHVPQGERVAVVRSYMAHHQGMSLVALDNYFYHDVMRDRFHREPVLAAAELLLQERVPRHAPLLQATKDEKPLLRLPQTTLGPSVREFSTPHTFTPRAHLLSNGAYSVMLTNAGGGYSAWSDDLAKRGHTPNTSGSQAQDAITREAKSDAVASSVSDPVSITRWRQDITLDALGTFCYIQDVDSGRVWSNAYQPTCVTAEHYHVVFAGETIEFLRRDVDIETKTEIFVAPDTDVEIRQVTLTNLSKQTRTLDLTSYAEVVLDAPRADAAHPAFSKLFIESEFATEHNALLFKRRPREVEQPERWVVHFLASDSSNVTVREYETDRAKFIGRGRGLADPAALYMPLSNTVGATLDPVMSLRTRVRLGPQEHLTLAFLTGAASSRATALELCDKFLDARDLERARESARGRGQMELQHLGITPADATLFQRFASRVLFPDPQLHAPTDVMERNTRGQEALWTYGISGDYPIVLVRIARGDSLNFVRQILNAHEYWRLRNLRVDVVILDEQVTSYAGETFDSIRGLVAASLSHPWMDKPGGIFVRRRDLFTPEDYLLLETAARVIVRSDAGELADQLNLSGRRVPPIGARQRRQEPVPPAEPSEENDGREFFNGIGGFSEHAQEYVITLNQGQWTPAPWTNILANPTFGCVVTEAGLGMTWSGNSQQNKLTPWSNDPVRDSPSEAIYLQDLDTNELWSPTPLPIREAEPYTIRHGAGYSIFEHTSHSLAQTLRVLVAPGDPVKILQLTLRNSTTRARRVRVTYYAEWVLGVTREEAQHFVVSEYDAATGAILARNVYKQEFAGAIAFAAATEVLSGFAASRVEFLGRNGTYSLPAALAGNPKPLSEQTGAGLDPCAALQVDLEIPPETETHVEFLLGQGEHRTHARALIQKYTDGENLQQAGAQVTQQWDALLETIQVKTTDAAMDALLNRWFLYQTLACRVWARAAFYQAGGAYGFRDQLQDVMALGLAAPEQTREQILRAAAHQFPEGDVMHWWHEPTGKGVRTRISDDYLWLPYVTEYYVRATGDTQILDEQIPFIEMPLLKPGQEEMFGAGQIQAQTASLYEHCVRALEHGLRFGVHGLPLMGTGDWNDGMNRVGVEGNGESVWLGWFLYSNLVAFAPRCESRGDAARANRFRDQAERLKQSLDESAWDGEWYRRAYFDDGTPLGSKENAECKIDAIAQAWAVISNAALQERQAQALDAVQQQLVRDQEKMILLLTPPFVNSQPNPGYIQGYVAGIRENGGQYTHGALWVVLAHALRGDGDRAFELYQMLNPLNHTSTMDQVNQYKVEPYVVAADVYSHPQHLGRGGWTWYTGSAGWMYRIGIEHLLGFQRRGNAFTMDPCIPHTWSEYEIVFRHRTTRFEIKVENPDSISRGVQLFELDGEPLETRMIALVDDGKIHRVRVVMGNRIAKPAV